MSYIVQSTPTAHDKTRELREISDEIASKKRELEILERDIKDRVHARELLIEKSGFTPHEFKKAEDEHVTATRAHQEKAANLRGQISEFDRGLKAMREERDIVKMEAESLAKRQIDLKDAILRLEHSLGSLEIEEQAHIDNFKKIKASTEAVLFPLRAEVEDLKREYAEKTRDLKERHEKTVEEEKVLAIKKTDIEIYEDRMRKKYPNETFIL